jgi:hypothetical protein
MAESHTSSFDYLSPWVRSFNESRATFENDEAMSLFQCLPFRNPFVWRTLDNKWRSATIRFGLQHRRIKKPLLVFKQAETEREVLKFNVGYDNGAMAYGLAFRGGSSLALLHTGPEFPIFIQLYYKSKNISKSIERSPEIFLATLEDNNRDPCARFRRGTLHFLYNVFPQYRNYPTRSYFYMGSYTPNQEDTCVVTQLSMERVRQLKELVENYKGPVSAAVFIRYKDFKNDAFKTLKKFYLESEYFRKFADIHVIYDDNQSPFHDYDGNDKFFYPIQFLRNVALKNARCKDWILYLESDMLLSRNGGAKIKKHISELAKRYKNEMPQAFILPLFFPSKRKDPVIPENKKSLEENGFNADATYDSHKFMNYSYWINHASEFLEAKIKWKHEPYFVVRRKHVRLYDSRVSCHQDKVSQVHVSAQRSSLEFSIFPDVFLVNLERRSIEKKFNRRGPSYCDFSRENSAQSALQWEQAVKLGPHLLLPNSGPPSKNTILDMPRQTVGRFRIVQNKPLYRYRPIHWLSLLAVCLLFFVISLRGRRAGG